MHRLQAALDDSLSFVENEVAARPLGTRRLPCEAATAESSVGKPTFDLDHPFSD
jgi:hypothetical protein